MEFRFRSGGGLRRGEAQAGECPEHCCSCRKCKAQHFQKGREVSAERPLATSGLQWTGWVWRAVGAAPLSSCGPAFLLSLVLAGERGSYLPTSPKVWCAGHTVSSEAFGAPQREQYTL
ncbi:hypothetical protein SUZIE_197305 [Sciurus carolinensis]|uniref:Uncharacterized protein n=1 Tax=Sciurus carolinensis TaxID=30640 RepID=A0AA41NDK3_SCICA|nr:hypothetical protein [Sciurus carolinensis]